VRAAAVAPPAPKVLGAVALPGTGSSGRLAQPLSPAIAAALRR